MLNGIHLFRFGETKVFRTRIIYRLVVADLSTDVVERYYSRFSSFIQCITSVMV